MKKLLLLLLLLLVKIVALRIFKLKGSWTQKRRNPIQQLKFRVDSGGRRHKISDCSKVTIRLPSHRGT